MNLPKIKDLITDIFGIIIWAVTIALWHCDKIDLWPEGTIGFGIGCLLFYVEDEWLTKQIKSGIKKFIDKWFSK